MNISNYITENSLSLFDHSYGPPIKIEYEQRKFTSQVFFCSVHFSNGIKKRLIIKHYDDKYPDRVSSLLKEYNFSKTHIKSFNSEDIGIPKYILFDPDNEIVVSEYVENSCTLERTLLTTQILFRSESLSKIFHNAGKWLSHYHSISAISNIYEINPFTLSSEIKDKWIKEFCNHQVIENDLRFLINNAIKEDHLFHISLRHKEYAPGNILHVENKVYGIDFGSSEHGCILDDIAYFIISVLVLNKFPNHPFYKRIRFNSTLINQFCEGYFSHSNIDRRILDSYLFKFFLYKNLVRRISSQLEKSNQLPRPLNIITKPLIYKNFYQIKHEFSSNQVKELPIENSTTNS